MTHDDWQAVMMSIRVTAVATLAFMPPCVLLGVWLGRTKSPFRGVVQTAATMPLVLPPVVTGLLLLHAMHRLGLQIAFTWLGAVVASGIVAAPLAIRTVHAVVETIDPRLNIAAESLGASRWRRFFTITLPLGWKGVVAGAILFAARALGEFGAVMVVAGNTPGRTQTIPLAIYSRLHSLTPGAIWPLTLAAVAIALVAMWTGERLVRSHRATSKAFDRQRAMSPAAS